MAGIFTGNGLGLFDSSLSELNRTFGSSSLGQGKLSSQVNVHNGNLVISQRDSILVGMGIDANVLRTYNSQGLFSDDNGDNWSFGVASLDLSNVESNITRITASGSKVSYEWNPDTRAYHSTAGSGAHDYIQATKAGYQWHLNSSDELIETYDINGRLINQFDRDNNLTEYSYRKDGAISTIETSDQLVQFNYTGKQVSNIRVNTFDGNTAEQSLVSTVAYYEYDNYGRLSKTIIDLSPEDNSIQDGNIYLTNYQYIGEGINDGRDGGNLLSSITQSDGTTISFTYQYYNGNKVIRSITQGEGETTTFRFGLSNSNGQYTQVTNQVGQSWLYFHNADGQITRVETPAVDGQRLVTRYKYDQDGNVNAIIHADNSNTIYEYDARGNRIFERGPTGTTIKRTFNEKNQLLTEASFLISDPDGDGPAQAEDSIISRLVYDSEGHVQFRLNQENEVTRYKYYNNGLLSDQIVYTASSYDASGLAQDESPSATDLLNWLSSIDQSKAQLTSYQYDFRGQLSRSTQYAQIDSTGQGISGTERTTVYVHDYMGRLLETISPRGTATADQDDFRTLYFYDGLGRLLGTQDAHGVSSSTHYADNKQKIVAKSADGLSTTTVYDAAGRIVSISQANRLGDDDNLGVSLFYYNEAGQLRATKGSDGAISYVFYDAAGRIKAEVDGSGSAVEYKRNLRGQVIETIAYATEVDTRTWISSAGEVIQSDFSIVRPTQTSNDRIVTQVFDSTGKLIESKDAENLVTTYKYDGAGRLIRTQIGNRIQRTSYDDTGRVIYQLDAEKALTENVYDDAGHLIKVIKYAKSVLINDDNNIDNIVPIPSPGDQVTHYYYNTLGQMTGKVDAENYYTRFSYDLDGNLIRQVEFYNKVTPNAYISVKYSTIDRVSAYEYNQLGQLIKETNYEGTVTEYSYDEVGNLIKTKAGSDNAVRRSYRSYDELGRITHTVNGVGANQLEDDATDTDVEAKASSHGTRFIYDNAGRKVKSIDANGAQTTFYYDIDGNVAITIDAEGGATKNNFNAFGEIESTTVYATKIDNVESLSGGAVNSVIENKLSEIADQQKDSHTTFEYNRRGQIRKILRDILDNQNQITPLETVHTYNYFGEKHSTSQQIDFSGRVKTTNYLYSKRGELSALIQQQGAIDEQVTTYGYDAFGRVYYTRNSLGHTYRNQYDKRGQVIYTQDPYSNRTATTYDAFGQVLTQTDQLGRTTRYEYDDANKTLTVTSPGGSQMVTTRNEHGETVKVIDGNGNSTQYYYNDNGLLEEQDNAEGGLQHFGYDQTGRLIWSLDERNIRTEYAYDKVGRVLTETLDSEGLNLTTAYSYDGKGQVLTTTDPRGVVTETHYDKLGQVNEIVKDAGGLNIRTAFEYDGLGNQVRVIEASGTSSEKVTDYIFDDLGRRIKTIIDPDGLAITNEYEYDKQDNVTRSIDANGNITLFDYDKNNRLIETRQDPDGLNITTSQTYDDAGQVKSQFDANGVETRLEYSDDGLLIKEIKDFSGLNITTQYEYDDNNNRIRIIDAKGVATRFYYDELNRVIETVRDEGGANISTYKSYDEVGNVIRRADGNGNLTHYTFDSANRLTFVIDPESYVTQNIYDSSNNIIEVRKFQQPVASKINWSEIDIRNTVEGSQFSPLNESFDDLSSQAFDFSEVGELSQNTIQHNNGALVFKNKYGQEEQRHSVKRNVGYQLVENVTTRFDISGVDVLNAINFRAVLENDAGDYFHGIEIRRDAVSIEVPDDTDDSDDDSDTDDDVIIADNAQKVNEASIASGDITGVNKLRINILSSNDQTIDFPKTIFMEEGQSYTVEIETSASGSSIYIYKSGALRISGVSHHMSVNSSAAIGEVNFNASTRISPNVFTLAPGKIILDNYSETVSSLSYTKQSFAYDALGRNTYIANQSGYVTKNTFNNLGQIIKTERFDKQINIDAVTTERDFELALRLNWYQDFSSSTSPLVGNFSSHRDLIRNEDGKLVFNTGYRESETWAKVAAPVQVYRSGMGYRAEVSTGETIGDELFMVAIDNSNEWFDADFKFQGAYFHDGQIKSFERQDLSDVVDPLTELAPNTTYVVELEALGDKTIIYIFEKGASRENGWSKEFETTNWDDLWFTMYTRGGPENVGRELTVDNVSEYDLSNNFPEPTTTEYLYDAAGRIVFSKDPEGNITENKYDQNGNVIASIKHDSFSSNSLALGNSFSKNFNDITQSAVWDIYDNDPPGATVTSVYDSEKKTNVTKLSGLGGANAYRLHQEEVGGNFNTGKVTELSIDLKFTENFFVYVELQTTHGIKTIAYRSDDRDPYSTGGYLWHFIGSDVKDGTWKTINRDLQADISLLQPGVEIISVKSVSVRGSGLIGEVNLAYNAETIRQRKRYTNNFLPIDLQNQIATHFVYDALNRVKYIVDPERYVTENIYDESDQLIEVRKYDKRASFESSQLDLGSLDRNKLNNPLFSSSSSLPNGWEKTFWRTDATSQGTQLSDFWSLNDTNAKTYWLRQSAPDIEDAYQQLELNTKVTEGKHYTFSAYTGAHRATVSIHIVWLNSEGEFISATATNSASQNARERTGGRWLSGYKRIFATGIAPEGAVTGKLILRKHNTDEGHNDSYLFAVKPQLEIVDSDNSTPTEWSGFTLPEGSEYQSTRYVYNAVGQQRFVIDAERYVTENILDDNGNVVETRSYDKQINAEAVRTEADVMRELRTSFAQDFNENLIGVINNTSSHPNLVYHRDGKVVFNRGNHSANAWPGIYRNFQNYESGKGFRAEVLVENTNYEYLSVAIDNHYSYSDTKYRRHNVHFSNGKIYAYERADASTNSVTLGDSKNNTTYSVELETHDGYTMLYVYEKGKERDTGYSHRFEATNWDKVRIRAFTFGRPNTSGAPIYLDNLSEYQVEGALPNYQSTKYEYNQLNQVIRTTDAIGYSETYQYDANGNQISMTNKRGHTWDYIYNANNQLIEEVSPEVTHYQYNGRSLREFSSRKKQSFSYDYNGNVTSIKDATGTDSERETRYEYDKLGNQTKVIHPTRAFSESSSETLYNAYGLAVVNRDVGDHISYKVYNKNSQEKFSVDSEGYITQYEHDAFGNVVKTIRYANAIDLSDIGFSEISADDIESRLVRSSLRDREINVEYDGKNNKSRVYQSHEESYFIAQSIDGTDYSDTPEKKFEYDAFSNLISESTKVNANDWATTRFFYDDNNRQVGLLNSENYLSTKTYDAYNNVIQTIDYARQLTGPVGNELPLAPGNGNAVIGYNRITQYEYNALNQKVKESRGTSNQNALVFNEWEYDQVGNLRAHRDELGQWVTNRYDALGRMTRTTEYARQVANDYVNAFEQYFFTSPTTEYYLDIHGNTLKDKQSSGQDQNVAADRVNYYFFDKVGNKTRHINASGSSTFYQYDDFGRVIQVSRNIYKSFDDWSEGNYNYTTKVKYSYDSLGRQVATTTDATIDGSTKQITQRAEFNAFGEQVSSTIKRSGRSEITLASYDYDKNGLLISSTEQGIDKTFQYDLQGRVTKQVIGGQQTTINQYDLLGRLTRQQLPTFTGKLNSNTLQRPEVQQSYDAWGNAIEVKEKHDAADNGFAVTTFQFNQLNKVTKKVAPRVEFMDAMGNAEQYITPTTEYTYNIAGQLLSVTDAKGNIQYKTYDIAGNLISETDALGNSTFYGYNAYGEKIATKNAIGTITTEHYNEAGLVTKSGIVRKDIEIDLRAYDYDQAGNRARTTRYFNTAKSAYEYSQFDQSGKVLKTRNGAGLELHYQYDMLGNKVYESDGNTRQADSDFKHKTWDYDIGTGRLIKSTDLQGRETNYNYNDLGQLITDNIYWEGEELESRSYEYYQNGLLKRIIQTAPDEAVLDYYGGSNSSDYYRYGRVIDYHVQYEETSEFEYDVIGNRTKENHETVRVASESYEMDDPRYDSDNGDSYDNDYEEGEVITINKTLEISREVNYEFDTHNRLTRLTSPQSRQKISGNTKDTTGIRYLDYKYDENGNRRNVVTVFDQRDSSSVGSVNHYYDYDENNRMIVSKGVKTGNGIDIDAGKGIKLTYNNIGQRVFSETFDKAYDYYGRARIIHNGQSASREVRGNKFSQELYFYNDLGQVNRIDKRTNWENLDYLVEDNDDDDNPPDEIQVTPGVSSLKGQEVTEDFSKLSGIWYQWKAFETGIYKTQVRKAYDYQGRVTAAFNYENGVFDSHTSMTYYDDDRIQWQFEFDTVEEDGNTQSVIKVQSDYSKEDAYDAAGNLSSYKTTVFKREKRIRYITPPYDFEIYYVSVEDYNTTYYKQYQGYSSYKLASDLVRTTAPYYRPGEVIHKYDARGVMMSANGRGNDGRIDRDFISSREGNILFRLDGTKGQDYFYYKGNQIGSAGEILTTPDFDFNYQAVSSSYPANTPGGYTVNSGDTLRSIAQSVFGDSSLWYLIADANGLSEDSTLQEGELLKVPNVVSNINNNSETFKPYNPLDVIGNTNPAPQFVPPPEPDKACLIIKTVLITAVAVAAAVISKGLLTPYFKTLVGAAWAPIVAGAASGAIASTASQLTSIALDMQQGFNWKDVAVGAVSGAATAGVAQGFAGGAENADEFIKGLDYFSRVGIRATQAIVSHSASYITNLAIDNGSSKFDWAGLAGSVLASPINEIGGGKNGDWSNNFFAKLGKGYASTSVSSLSRVIANQGKYDWMMVAADAFGNAIGSSIGYEIERGIRESGYGKSRSGGSGSSTGSGGRNPKYEGVSSLEPYDIIPGDYEINGGLLEQGYFASKGNAEDFLDRYNPRALINSKGQMSDQTADLLEKIHIQARRDFNLSRNIDQSGNHQVILNGVKLGNDSFVNQYNVEGKTEWATNGLRATDFSRVKTDYSFNDYLNWQKNGEYDGPSLLKVDFYHKQRMFNAGESFLQGVSNFLSWGTNYLGFNGNIAQEEAVHKLIDTAYGTVNGLFSLAGSAMLNYDVNTRIYGSVHFPETTALLPNIVDRYTSEIEAAYDTGGWEKATGYVAFDTQLFLVETLLAPEEIALKTMGKAGNLARKVDKALPDSAKKIDVPNTQMTRAEPLRAKWGHLSSSERSALMQQKVESNAERWVRNYETQLSSEYPGLNPHFVDKHGPDIPIDPNLKQRSITGAHPRNHLVPGNYPQPSSQFKDWQTQMHVLNEATSRQARGLTEYNYFMNGNPNKPAVIGSYDSSVGWGFTKNNQDLLNPHFHPSMNNWIVPLDKNTLMPYTAYPKR
ncbi:MAG: LysM peptidoglycan-binding domain-containing protein [Gammaproteobacteria bacterium]|nr:LysM peptidoglycan-binding domain-containing protein [Gammaproteobacteria bacterium]